jgi:hypothetical protein
MNVNAKSLIAKGYFPRELPPPFTTAPLAGFCSTSAAQLPVDRTWTEASRHNLARLNGYRRPLRVPNPRSFLLLADVLEANWATLDSHFKSQQIAISRPVVTRTAERAIRPRFRLGEAPKLRTKHWRGQRFVLNSDVGQFYPSLYTHSIPWALHKKAVVKATLKKGVGKGKQKKSASVGDAIDDALRCGSSGQTIGIPIGPDSSFVAAEIVLTAVDELLGARMPRLRAWRYLDDYEAAFRSRAEAEEAPGHLEGALGDFELVINPFKTHIRELPQPFNQTWAQEILAFPVRQGSPRQTQTDIIALFSKAAEIAKHHAGALRYTLRICASHAISSKMWNAFQGLVWSAVSAEPTTMPVALDLLAMKSLEIQRPINKEAAADVIEAQILTNAPLRNGSEVAWALWAAVRFEVSVSAQAASAIVLMEDDFVALTALYAASEGRFSAQLDTGPWETLIDHDEVLLHPHWLLAYEASGQGWLSSAVSRVTVDDFFGVLHKQGVRFFDPTLVRRPFTGAAGPLPGGTFPDEYL